MKALVIGGLRRQLESVAAAGYDVTWLIAQDALLADVVKLPVRRLYAFSPDDPVDDVFALAMSIQLDRNWSGATEVLAQAARRGVSSIRYMVPPAPDCRITALGGVDDARARPGVLDVHAIRMCGKRTRLLGERFGRPAYVRATRPTRQELDATLDQAVGGIRFSFGDGGQEQGRACDAVRSPEVAL